MQNAVINVNGEILALGPSLEEARRRLDTRAGAKVPVFDRSYLYGDSLYEVARTYEKRLFGLEEHLDRLERSATLLRLTLGQPRELLRAEAQRTLDVFFRECPSADEAYLRLVVSRGTGKIGFGLGTVLTPTTTTWIAQPLEEPSAEQLARGYSMRIVERARNSPRALDPAMKSGNYLNSLLAFLEAAAEGFDDALMLDAEGFVTEGTTFNVFYVKRGIVVTPPLEVGILDGITRRILLGICRDEGIPFRVTHFGADRLRDADEVFLSSTIKEAFPITRIDGRPIGSGRPGAITSRLRATFHARALSAVRDALGGAA